MVTGCNGQDASYLIELLLGKGYNVYGTIRRSSVFTTERINHILNTDGFEMIFSDMTDHASICDVLYKVKPDEIYHLAAMSHVKVSFEIPVYTMNTNLVGTLALLEAVRNICPQAKVYFAGTSEMFGNTGGVLNEDSPMKPVSPYGISKLSSKHLCELYRSIYNMHITVGILFNHESCRRGNTFVTKKIANYVCNGNFDSPLQLGNLDAIRDWGYAPDYVHGMWLMLQKKVPDTYVLATGEGHSVREFCNTAFELKGHTLHWVGSGINEKGYVGSTLVITIDNRYFRECEIDVLIGDSSKARAALGWKPSVSFTELVAIMGVSDV